MDVEKYMEYYKTELGKLGFTWTTTTGYIACVKQFLRYFESKENVFDITLEEVADYINLWKVPNTQYSKLGAVRSFYKLLKIDTVDFSSFDKPKRIKALPKRIDKKFLLERINDVDNRKHKALLMIAYSTGMNLTEILNLELKSIDFENDRIFVANTFIKKSRFVVLSAELKKTLNHYIKKFTPTKYLFNGQNSPKYSKRSALSTVKNHIGEKYTFHMIRQTHIYDIIESGADIKAVQKHLGLHGSSSVKTLNLYKKNTLKNNIQPPV